MTMCDYSVAFDLGASVSRSPQDAMGIAACSSFSQALTAIWAQAAIVAKLTLTHWARDDLSSLLIGPQDGEELSEPCSLALPHTPGPNNTTI